jgi:hypothetical protein
MSLILNFLTEISIIEGNPQALPQIRIDDVEATGCLNVTAIICPNNLRLIIICRLGTCVRSIVRGHALPNQCLHFQGRRQYFPRSI